MLRKISPGERAATLAKESEGLGDTIHKLTARAGIAPCEGCIRRGKKLNKLVKYKRKATKNTL